MLKKSDGKSFDGKRVNQRYTTTAACVHTLFAYFSEFRDSSKLADDGLMQQIISVFALPPKESYYTSTQSTLLQLVVIKN